ncbi:MAG: portal protein, partial [bacterium]
VGAIPPNEVENYIQRMIGKMKKTPLIDAQTGQYNMKFNQQNLLEDFFIPVRGNDQSTRIDTAKGLEYNAIEDVQYFREKLFAALKIPKAFMGYEKDLTGKATLAAEDIRFARTIERIQRIIVSELKKVALVHLYAHG